MHETHTIKVPWRHSFAQDASAILVIHVATLGGSQTRGDVRVRVCSQAPRSDVEQSSCTTASGYRIKDMTHACKLMSVVHDDRIGL